MIEVPPVRAESQALAEAQSFGAKLNDAARRLFGDDERCSQLLEVSRRLQKDCRQLAQRGGSDVPAIAIVGKLAEGKSWLARCFLTDHEDNQQVRQSVRSGGKSEDRTSQLIWLGPHAPLALYGQERFVRVPSEQMLDLGRPYIVGDAPGFSSIDAYAEDLAFTAIHSAAVKLLVLSLDNLRDDAIPRFLKQMEGALVLPVVRYKPDPADQSRPGQESETDVRQELKRWRRAAPGVEVLDPCFIPDKDIFDGGEPNAMRLVQDRLQARIEPRLADAVNLRKAVEDQIRGRLRAARREAAELLKEYSQRVRSHVERLEALQNTIPERLPVELLGDDILLRAGVRRRFRADWIDRTPSWCFPYRSFLGLLALTAGAWDRLVFSIMGSTPSLALTFFQSFKNLRDARDFTQRTRAGLTDRIESLVNDRLSNDLLHFNQAVTACRAGRGAGAMAFESKSVIRVVGIEEVEFKSQKIIGDVIKTRRANPAAARSFGTVAVIVFFCLLAGPTAAVYREYLEAWRDSFVQPRISWTDFPAPSFSMLFASSLLSAAPAFLLALAGLSWCCRSRRVEEALKDIKGQHEKMLVGARGDLRIELTDSRLDAARFLLGLSTEHAKLADKPLSEDLSGVSSRKPQYARKTSAS